MSADRWSICPRCYAYEDRARQKQIDEAVASAQAAYGVAAPEEYIRLNRAVDDAKGKSLYLRSTLREDYSIGIDSSDAFAIEYRAKCSECGFAHTFKHSNPLTV